MDGPVELTAQNAFKALVNSYLTSHWQRRHGTRHSLGGLDWIRYSYAGAEQVRTADMFFVADVEPGRALMWIHDQDPADKHLILTLATRSSLVAEYMSAGCSYLAPPSYLMARYLDDFPASPSDFEILLLSRADQVKITTEIEGADSIYPADLEDPALNHYVAYRDGKAAAVARLTWLEPDISWISHVYTAVPFRSQGMATALMQRLMTDSQASGSALTCLLATEEARSLYRRLDFLELGAVLNFIISQ